MEDPALVLTLSSKMTLPHNDDTILSVQVYDIHDLIDKNEYIQVYERCN